MGEKDGKGRIETLEADKINLMPKDPSSKQPSSKNQEKLNKIRPKTGNKFNIQKLEGSVKVDAGNQNSPLNATRYSDKNLLS